MLQALINCSASAWLDELTNPNQPVINNLKRKKKNNIKTEEKNNLELFLGVAKKLKIIIIDFFFKSLKFYHKTLFQQ